MLFPARSENEAAGTVIVARPFRIVGVKSAVYMHEHVVESAGTSAAKLDNTPPTTEISLSTKLFVSSLDVNVNPRRE